MADSIRKLWARWRPLLGFTGSQDYWRGRYRRGGDSGVGSGGAAARHKADVVNAFVSANNIRSIVEFGCGDGRQLELARYPQYHGYDISVDAVDACRRAFSNDASKRFALVAEYDGSRSDLALSLDVLFHLVEDDVYEAYLTRLFDAAERFVVIHSSDVPQETRSLPHVRHRFVSRDIANRFTDFEPFHVTVPPGPFDQASPPMTFLFYRRRPL